ncbi:MAG TPA: hypothetical protein DIT64_02855 [Verrucomicrobiales bacterium]|nr:hypothetical protein [Verrucomicrobiales bacterium]
MSSSFRNRSHQCFVSYSHQDAGFAGRLVVWLGAAGIPVWLDETSLGVGEKVARALPDEMSQCRGMLLLASRRSMESNWVRQEINAALLENVENPAFAITIIRLDDVDIASHVPALRQFKWIEAGTNVSVFEPGFLVDVVNSLHRRAPSPILNHQVDVYVSRSDRNAAEIKRSDAACRRLSAHHGIHLIGDAVDQADFSEERIRILMGTCSSHLLVLPARAKEADYKYFLRERAISESLNLPCLVCAEPGSPLPEGLRNGDHFIELQTGGDDILGESGRGVLEAFLDDTRATTARHSASIFFAHEYNQNQERNRAARNLLASVTGLTPHAGSDFTSAIGPRQILDGISRSAWFVADLGSKTNPETGRLDVNVNTCIEVGIALGAGLGKVCSTAPGARAERPVYALSFDRTAGQAGAAGETGKTRDIPWMLRSGITIQWYASDTDFLAIVHRIARGHRRRLLNAEL